MTYKWALPRGHWKLKSGATKATKPSIWQKPWTLIHKNHRPPTKVGMGQSPTLWVSQLFQWKIRTLLMWNAPCMCLKHTAWQTTVWLSFIDSHTCVEEICNLMGGRLRAQVGVVSGQRQAWVGWQWPVDEGKGVGFSEKYIVSPKN